MPKLIKISMNNRILDSTLATYDEDVFKQALPLFEIMGKKSVYLGAIGKGTSLPIFCQPIIPDATGKTSSIVLIKLSTN